MKEKESNRKLQNYITVLSLAQEDNTELYYITELSPTKETEYTLYRKEQKQ